MGMFDGSEGAKSRAPINEQAIDPSQFVKLSNNYDGTGTTGGGGGGGGGGGSGGLVNVAEETVPFDNDHSAHETESQRAIDPYQDFNPSTFDVESNVGGGPEGAKSRAPIKEHAIDPSNLLNLSNFDVESGNGGGGHHMNVVGETVPVDKNHSAYETGLQRAVHPYQDLNPSPFDVEDNVDGGGPVNVVGETVPVRNDHSAYEAGLHRAVDPYQDFNPSPFDVEGNVGGGGGGPVNVVRETVPVRNDHSTYETGVQRPTDPYQDFNPFNFDVESNVRGDSVGANSRAPINEHAIDLSHLNLSNFYVGSGSGGPVNVVGEIVPFSNNQSAYETGVTISY